jgi:hypothetical protein
MDAGSRHSLLMGSFARVRDCLWHFVISAREACSKLNTVDALLTSRSWNFLSSIILISCLAAFDDVSRAAIWNKSPQPVVHKRRQAKPGFIIKSGVGNEKPSERSGGLTLAAWLLFRATSAFFANHLAPIGRLVWASTQLLMTAQS